MRILRYFSASRGEGGQGSVDIGRHPSSISTNRYKKRRRLKVSSRVNHDVSQIGNARSPRNRACNEGLLTTCLAISILRRYGKKWNNFNTVTFEFRLSKTTRDAVIKFCIGFLFVASIHYVKIFCFHLLQCSILRIIIMIIIQYNVRVDG